MKRILVSATFLAGGLLAAAPRPAQAQLTAGVHVSWQRSDDGWQAGPIVDGYVHVIDRAPRRGGGYGAPARVLPVYAPRFRVPPGHLPPPGMCRAWVVGRPPGHQPPPMSCRRVFRTPHSHDVVILHTPARGSKRWNDGRGGWDDDRWDDDRWDDDRWDDDRREDDRSDRGRRRGRARGG